MSDILRVQNSIRRLSPSRPINTLRRSPLTASQLELMPYVEQAKAEREEQEKRLTPLDIFFNILSTGQYVSANVADSIVESMKTGRPLGEATIEALKGAWLGLTWQKKGDYEKTIESILPEDAKAKWNTPILGEWAKGKPFIGTTPLQAAGFAANVLLDPTTYLTVGATKGSQAAAREYAEHSVKMTLAELTPDALRQVVKSELPQGAAEAILKAADPVKKVMEFVGKKKNFARYLDDVYKKAYKLALGTPAEQLYKQAGQRFQDIASKITPQRYQELMPLREKIAQGYKGAGEWAFRTPLGDWAKGGQVPTAIGTGWNTLKQRFGESKAGSTFGNAWWAVMNRGPIGWIKQALGIRNPYQTILNIDKQDARAGMERAAFELNTRLGNILGKTDEATRTKMLQARALAEQLEFNAKAGAKVLTTKEILSNPEYLKALKLQPEEALKISKAWGELDELNEFLKKNEKQFMENLSLDPYDEIINYLPKHQEGVTAFGGPGKEMGSSAKGFTKDTTFTMQESINQGKAAIKYFYGDTLAAAAQRLGMSSDQLAEKLVIEKGLAPVSTDLVKMWQQRIMGYARAQQRYEMVNAFKEFGVDISSMMKQFPNTDPDMAARMFREGYGIPEGELIRVSDPALKNMVFDKDTAAIINNVFQSIGSDEAINRFQKLMNSMTSWWKGAATLTTGFHLRNFTSNNVTGFLNYGFDWFKAKNYMESMAMTVYALHPDKYADILKNTLNVTDGWIARTLNKSYGEYTGKQLADYMAQKGVISAHTNLSDFALKEIDKGKALRKAVNPLSKEFAGFKVSRTVGDYVENSARAEGFLIDFKKLVQGGNASTTALEYAKNNAKKVFIDYGNLTDFEKKYMKNIIPFYSWLRNNLANQITGMISMPQMYSLIPKATKAFTYDEGFDYEIQPDWQKNLGMFPVGFDQATGEHIMFFPNFPYTDINKIPISFSQGGQPQVAWHEVRDDVMSNAHPLLKSAVEMLTGYNTWKRREIFKWEEAPQLAQYIANRPDVVQFLDGVMRMAGFDNFIRVNKAKNKVEMNGNIQRLLETNMPYIRNIGVLIRGAKEGVSLVTATDNAVSAAQKKKDIESALDAALDSLSTYGGFKLSLFPEDYYREQRAMEIEKKAEEARTEYKQSLPGYAKQTTAYQAQRATRRRKLGL